jgi:hypothetical protein
MKELTLRAIEIPGPKSPDLRAGFFSMRAPETNLWLFVAQSGEHGMNTSGIPH